MRSFENDFYLHQLPSHALLVSLRVLGEHRGREALFMRQSPEVLETLREIAVAQSVESSNRIEGVTAPPDRLRAILARTTRPKNRSESEIAGYRNVLSEIPENADRLALSPSLILRFHRRMFAHAPEVAGQWKRKDNLIQGLLPDGRPYVRFRPVPASETPAAVERLCSLFRAAWEARKADPVPLIAAFFLDFECIHPFPDGNGRLGRLLATLLLSQAGYGFCRYVSLERVIEESRETYYEALRDSSEGWHRQKHELAPWWNYFSGVLIAAYRELEEKAEALGRGHGAKRELVLAAIGRLPDAFTMRELRLACPSVSPEMVRVVLRELKAKGAVACSGKGPGTMWRKRQ